MNAAIQLLSIVIPIYNEKSSLHALCFRTNQACAALAIPYEIILVDDGSEDGSLELLETAADDCYRQVVVVQLNRNYGQHAAIMAGFRQAIGDLVITLDADLQNPPEEIGRLVAAAEKGYDVVGTVRKGRQDPLFRKVGSKFVNRMIQRTTGKGMEDYGCMLRAYRRHVVEAMLACNEQSIFIPLLANSFAKRSIEIPVAHAEREHGESKYGLWQLIHLMFDLFTSMTTTPLRLLSIVGSGVAFSGFLLSILLIILRLAYGSRWSGDGIFTLFAILFTFIGVQIMGIGILGEYIGRIYNEVRGRPRYFVGQVFRPSVSKTSNVSQSE